MKIRILIVVAIIFVSCKKEEKSQNEKVKNFYNRSAKSPDFVATNMKHNKN